MSPFGASFGTLNYTLRGTWITNALCIGPCRILTTPPGKVPPVHTRAHTVVHHLPQGDAAVPVSTHTVQSVLRQEQQQRVWLLQQRLPRGTGSRQRRAVHTVCINIHVVCISLGQVQQQPVRLLEQLFPSGTERRQRCAVHCPVVRTPAHRQH